MTQSQPSAVQTGRDETLDFVKGVLVLVMVLYHWLNYFVTLDWDVYRYLRFLTPSFILITGFLVSHVYLKRYARDSSRINRRLVQRGLKLLLLFIVLNLVVDLAMGGRRTDTVPTSWADRASAVFLAGDGTAVFNILVPIGYFLLLAPAVFLLSGRAGIPITAIAAAALAAAIAGDFLGHGNSHFEFLAIALVGLAGATDFSRIDAILRRPGLLVFGYVLYLAAITAWNILFPLQVIGVCLSVLLIYLVGVKLGTGGAIQRCVVELGMYSLFAYITQIAVLQLLRQSLRRVDLKGVELLVPFAVCQIATIVTVRLMIAVRVKSPFADSLYRTVFA